MSAGVEVKASVAPPTARLTPLKSFEDKREYRYLTLSNQLQVLLCQDVDTDKAACAMDVKVGHFSDPAEAPGLAHFLEHMLFLGTKKYPDENSYSAYLNAHGGHSNAFTDMENTNYHFEVQHPYLEESLDRFAQFFVAPLFTHSATDREMQAVHNENQKNLQSDPWRFFQLVKSTASPTHPFSKFGTGNLATLRDEPKAKGIDVRELLLAFHREYYSANQMKLFVIGRESLDTLEKWVVDRFSIIVNSGRAAPSFTGSAFGPSSLGRIFSIAPVKDLKVLSILWPLPPTTGLYKEKPLTLLSHLLGHEGIGSILALLKAKGWASSLSAGANHETSSFAGFVISIELSPEGMKHIPDIFVIIYQYIALLRAADTATWKRNFDECKALAEMGFRFKSKEEPADYVTGIAIAMQKYAPADALSGAWLYERFDEKLIQSYLSGFTPENMTAQLASQEFAGTTDQVEKWYETPYRSAPFDETLVKLMSAAGENKELALPQPNEFIPSDFTLKNPVPETKAAAPTTAAPTTVTVPSTSSASTTTGDAAPATAATASTTAPAAPTLSETKDKVVPPVRLGRTGVIAPASGEGKETKEVKRDEDVLPGVRLWWKPDLTFRKPKANVIIRLVSPLAYTTPAHGLLTTLFTKLVEDSLNEYSYSADLAGLSYSLQANQTGVQLVFRGYNHKLPVLMTKTLQRMMDLTVIDDRFNRIRDQVQRALKNVERDQPYQHAIYKQQMIAEDGLWSNAEKLATIAGLTPDDVRAHARLFLRQAEAEIFVHGNASEDDARSIARLVTETLRFRELFSTQFPAPRVVQLAEGRTYLWRGPDDNKDDMNSTAVLCFQIGEDTPANTALLDLMSHISREPVFNVLRTNEQLGYLVWSGVQSQKGIVWWRVIVQSGDRSADYLESRIEAFIAQYRSILAGMSAEDFNTNRAAVVREKEESDKTLNAETNRHWGEIQRRAYLFNRVELEVSALRAASLTDVVAFWDRYILINTPTRRKLTIQLFGKAQAVPGGDALPYPITAPKPAAAPVAVAATADTATAATPAVATSTPATSTSSETETGAETPAVAVAVAVAPAAPLLAAPADTSSLVLIDDWTAFKRSMPLYPVIAA